MSSSNTAPRTAVSTQVAAEGSAVPFQQMERMAAAMAKSGLFGVKTSDQALALMLISQAEGRSPALAAQEYHIIQNRPSLKADTLLARYQQAGGTVKWTVYTDKNVTAVFTHPASGSVTVEWTIEMAKAAGLTGKDIWKAYPRAMLRSRVIAEGVRTSYPGVAVGIYTPEELSDGAPEIDVTPVSQNEAIRQTVEAHTGTMLTDEERQEHFDAMDAAPDQVTLAHAFASAWKHAGAAKDKAAQDAFKTVYDAKKEALASAEVPT